MIAAAFDDDDHIEVGAEVLFPATKNVAQSALPTISDHGVTNAPTDGHPDAGVADVVFSRIHHNRATFGAFAFAASTQKLRSLS